MVASAPRIPAPTSVMRNLHGYLLKLERIETCRLHVRLPANIAGRRTE